MVKRLLILILFTGCMVTTRAQDKDTLEIITALTSWPIFQDDNTYQKLTNFVKENLHYDDTITTTKIVRVKFIVDTTGNTYNHEIVSGYGNSTSLNDEALRVCRLLKFSKPAMQGDKPVSVWFYIPVQFEPKQVIKPKHYFFKHHLFSR